MNSVWFPVTSCAISLPGGSSFRGIFFLVSPILIIILLLFILCNMLNTYAFTETITFSSCKQWLILHGYYKSTINWFVKIKYILNSKPTFPWCSENITNLQCDCTIYYPAIILARIVAKYFFIIIYLYYLFCHSNKLTLTSQQLNWKCASHSHKI